MRARLTVEQGVASPRVYEMDASAVVHLGRNRDNTVVLGDRHASRWHAQIYASNGRWFIRDQGTTNGTRVRGEPITTEAPLEDNDEIAIAETRLRFRLDGSKTDEMPVLLADEDPHVVPAGDDTHTTVLEADELTALFRFMNTSLAETAPHRLVSLALEAVLRQTKADLAGFLSLDVENPDFMLVLPAQAPIDRHLSHHL